MVLEAGDIFTLSKVTIGDAVVTQWVLFAGFLVVQYPQSGDKVPCNHQRHIYLIIRISVC